MAVGANLFQNVLGTPGDPQFVEFLYRGHAVEADGSSQQFINQLHFVKSAGVGVPTNLANLNNLVQGTVGPALAAALSVAYVPDNVTLRAMDSPLNLAVPFANALVGAQAGDRLPSFNSVVTRKYTYGRGRSFRGSNHWGPIAETDTLLDQLTAAAQIRWDALANVLQLFVNANDADANAWTLFVLSPTLSDLIANPSAFTGSKIRLSTANAVIGTMKRRKQGVGV